MTETAVRGRPWWQDPSWIAALGAVLLGVSGVSVSLYQAKLMHEQQRMSVWPFLTVISDNTELAGKGVSRLVISNDGVGPALIQQVGLWLDDRPMRSWAELFNSLDPNRQRDMAYTTVHGRVLPAGRTIEAVVIDRPEDIASLQANFGRIRFELCYCSVYHECHLLRSAVSDVTTPVSQCPAATEPPFAN